MKYLLPVLLLTLCAVASAQHINSIPCYPDPPCKPAQVKPYSDDHDKLKLSASFVSPVTDEGNLKGFSAEVDYRLIKAGGFRLGAVAQFQRVFDQEVIPMYLGMFDIYRDVNTYSAGVQLSYGIGPVSPFATFLLGTRRLHEDFDYDIVRKYRAGADVSVGEYFFIRPFFVEFEATGKFNSGTTHKYGAGAGFKF